MLTVHTLGGSSYILEPEEGIVRCLVAEKLGQPIMRTRQWVMGMTEQQFAPHSCDKRVAN